MHVSSYLACEKIQVELALFRESITISIGECNYGSNISVTFSRSQVQAIVEGLQEALREGNPAKGYPDVILKKGWVSLQKENEKEAGSEAAIETAPITKAA